MKHMIGSFLATGFIAISPGNNQAFANPTEEAWKHASKAIYLELELNEFVNKQAERLERKYLPDSIRKYGPYIGIGMRAMTERRLSYTWKF